MSIARTATDAYDRDVELGGDEDRPSREWVFDEVAFHNDEVCSACFAEIRDVHEIDYGDTDPPDVAPDQDRRRNGDGEHGWYEFADGAARTHEPRTYCGCCGARSGRADDQTLSRREMLGHAERLHDRLVEAGYPSDLRVLKAYVRAAKNRDDESDDTRVYRLAVAGMLRRLRRQ